MAYKKAFDDIFIRGAIHTVASVGIERTRTKDIAKHAGFTEATMFRSFPTKEMLLQVAFLTVEKRIYSFVTQNVYIRQPDKTPFRLVAYAIWHKVYRYLIENPEETLFLLRYRYSSLYTEELRNRREAYNGSMDEAYALFEKELGSAPTGSWQVFISAVFDVTLCLTEKIVAGEIADTEKTEFAIWNIIRSMVEEVEEITPDAG